MSEDNRVALTAVLWFFSALAIGAVFISAGIMSELTVGHLAIALVILALDVVATPILLRWKGETEQEKAKQHRIDTLLGDMSDEELVELKKRLSGGDFNDGHVAALGDDGELIRRR
jgi:membrane protein YdbS with pleckstrin-like domain